MAAVFPSSPRTSISGSNCPLMSSRCANFHGQICCNVNAVPYNGHFTTRNVYTYSLPVRRFLQFEPITDPARRTLILSASSGKSSAFPSNSSADKSLSPSRPNLTHHFSLSIIIGVIQFIWRLPGMISDFFNKEEKILAEIEDDIDKAANAIKTGAKVVEDLAEGIEKVGEAVHDKKLVKVGENIASDAKKVEQIMDKVKDKSKAVHEELEEINESVEKALNDVRKGSERADNAGRNGNAISKREMDDSPIEGFAQNTSGVESSSSLLTKQTWINQADESLHNQLQRRDHAKSLDLRHFLSATCRCLQSYLKIPINPLILGTYDIFDLKIKVMKLLIIASFVFILQRPSCILLYA
ncbi:hypothetical protein KP509_12G088300 [Ceratopteris richardii]|uniref:Uncharacterized protein n=1 Tax=Ceratopteris richardii TaxID=49495 RepID=A0A8T2TKX9_CERRI|nr:hypothetical protein KP509_12G088300 [Ceratopteris richardii]